MICYIVRHGKDDETVRGGWSQQPLTEEGIRQAEKLADSMCAGAAAQNIEQIYSSDLQRAVQTAGILAARLQLPVVQLPQFREVNNGELAGMDNDVALVRYPGLFWNRLGWEQCYPGGESPKQFYERISAAWTEFSEALTSAGSNAVLVTHGGVIHVIRAIVENRPYSNSEKHKCVAHAEAITLRYENGRWKEIL